MTVPDYEAMMLPLLRLAGQQEELAMREAAQKLAAEFHLTDEEKDQLLPSGQETVLNNRVGWARTYMKKAGLLESPRRGFIKITPRGREILQKPPERIGDKFLRQFPEFVAFQTVKRDIGEAPPEARDAQKQTPEESLEFGHQKLQKNLEAEVLSKVKSATPEFFERLVVDLLVKMGYGGSRQDAGKAVGRSGDEGIDGIINEDRLGLDVIYIQAKRWTNAVDRAEIQKFAGALQGKRAKKGIFITTSSFGKSARDYAGQIESKIVLIDGEELSRLMVEHDVGVSKVRTLDVKKLDQDYFVEE